MTAFTTSLLRWAPRVLSILFVMFLSIFASDQLPEGDDILGIISVLLFFGQIFIGIAIIIFAWKWELVGAIVFTAFSLFYGIAAISSGIVEAWLIFCAPMTLIGILYFISWRIGKQVTA